MNIKITSEGNITIARIDGRVDEKAAMILEEKLTSMLKSGKTQVLVDLTGIEFIGSSGIGKLLNTGRALQKAGGQMGLSSIPVRFKPAFESIWGSAGTALIPIFESPKAALKIFQNDPNVG